jgi:shikimate kinase
MVVLLIGPSRAGKSTLGKRAVGMLPKAEFFDLDMLVEKRRQYDKAQGVQDAGWAQFWHRSQAELQALEAKHAGADGIAIIAVGAGSLQTSEGRAYIQQAPNVIAITASFESILSRHPGRDPAELRTTEFSDDHMSLYSAVPRIDTGIMDEASAAQELSKMIGEMESQANEAKRRV